MDFVIHTVLAYHNHSVLESSHGMHGRGPVLHACLLIPGGI